MHVVDIVYLQPVRRGQDHIGDFRHGPHKLIAVHKKLEVHQGGNNFFCIRQMKDLLPAHAEPHLDNGVAGEQLFDHRIRVGRSSGPQFIRAATHDMLLHFFRQRNLEEEILKQPQYVPMSLENMVIELFAGTRGFTDNVPLERMGAWETAMLRFMESNYPEIVKDIATRKQIIPETEQKLRAALDAFMSTWS